MQTSQIKLGDLYAINTPNHGVVRFEAQSIKTVSLRTVRNPRADTTNVITGLISEGDMPGTVEERTRDVSPEAVISSYTEYAELKARQAKEDAIQQEKQDREKDLRERLRLQLYRVSGMVRPPKNPSPFRQNDEPFSTPYGNQITITPEAIQPLLEALERLGRV